MNAAHLRLQGILGAQVSGEASVGADEALELLNELERLWLIEEAVHAAAKEWAELCVNKPRATLEPDAVVRCLHRALGAA